MNIPTKDEFKEAEIVWSYSHFKDRLLERYGLDITYNQYLQICKGPFIMIARKSKNLKYGIIEFNGKIIFVVKERDRRIITCLQKTGSVWAMINKQ